MTLQEQPCTTISSNCSWVCKNTLYIHIFTEKPRVYNIFWKCSLKTSRSLKVIHVDGNRKLKYNFILLLLLLLYCNPTSFIDNLFHSLTKNDEILEDIGLHSASCNVPQKYHRPDINFKCSSINEIPTFDKLTDRQTDRPTDQSQARSYFALRHSRTPMSADNQKTALKARYAAIHGSVSCF